jgi:hypothetical protein
MLHNHFLLKVRVMTKQLNLFRSAIHAYFTGNKVNLALFVCFARCETAYSLIALAMCRLIWTEFWRTRT